MKRVDIMLKNEKELYYEYFIEIKPFINLSAICSASGVNRRNFNAFLVKKDLDKMSIENLSKVKRFIEEVLG